jgi:hypothetical protein
MLQVGRASGGIDPPALDFGGAARVTLPITWNMPDFAI